MSRWILGRTPPLEMALAVQKVTGIDPADWLVPVEESSSTQVTVDAQHAREVAS